MPTKRTRRSRGRTVLTLDSLTVPDLLDFMIGWQPARPMFPHEAERKRWDTYAEFLADYLSVREDFLNSVWATNPATQPVFAEWLIEQYGEQGPPEYYGWIPGHYPAEMPNHRVLVEYWEARRSI